MKKITNKLLALSTCFIFSATLVGCHNEIFKVTFKDYDGMSYMKQK